MRFSTSLKVIQISHKNHLSIKSLSYVCLKMALQYGEEKYYQAFGAFSLNGAAF